MAFPEVYLAHSISLAKKIKSKELNADYNILATHLGECYTESVKDRIIKVAIELSQYDDITKAARSAEYRKRNNI